MKAHHSESRCLTRRHFIHTSALAATAAVVALPEAVKQSSAADTAIENQPASTGSAFPCGQIGKARISRLLLGGNLISGNMHSRDLKYTGALFRAYVTEEKLMQTLRLAEQQGINTVFETGAQYVDRYNREFRGHMQFIPHIEVAAGQTDAALQDHIKKQVDTGAVALYVWGVSGDTLVRDGAVDRIHKAVEMAKASGLPVGVGTGWQAEHAAIINEYDWLWLHRDGTPTHLTRKVYDHLLGPSAAPQQRFALNGYLLGGLTEFWRAQRRYAGVMYLPYLDGDLPHAFTCDNFRDVAALKLEPHFEDYMREAFKPLGVYLEFWQPALVAGAKRSYRVTLVNDTPAPLRGRLTLAWQAAPGGKVVSQTEQAFAVPPAGRSNCDFELAAPSAEGQYQLTAKASCDGQRWSPTLSRRQVTIGKTEPK